MDADTRNQCYPGLTDGEIESMSGGVFGHSFLVLLPYSTSTERPNDRLQWDPTFCRECRWRGSLFVPQNGEDGTFPILRNYNYRCCPSCWSIIKMQLWDYLEGKVSENPANWIWSFLVESSKRSKDHLEHFHFLLRTGWPPEYFRPMVPVASYSQRSRSKGWSS